MKKILGLLGLLWAGLVYPATFSQFSPATGVLKGASNTYVTTPAVSSDIRGLWSGTCDNTTFLRGDGACATAVTSVGLTVPSGLSVSGSPITGSGTLNITTLLNGIVKGNGSGFTTAASLDVRNLWSGTCDNTTFLRGDGACNSVGTVTSVGLSMPTGFSVSSSPVTGSGTLTVAYATGQPQNQVLATPNGSTGALSIRSLVANDIPSLGANPTGTIGLTAVNGSANTYVRSDGAPALSQAIVPTWTGAHSFSNTITSTLAGSGASWNYTGSSSQPGIAWNETDQAADTKLWREYTNGGTLNLETCTDNAATCRAALSVTRSTAAVSTISYGNATDNPSNTFLGSGATTFNGTVRIGTGSNIQPVFGMAYGIVTDNGATCTIARSSGGSCARNATGTLTFTFTNAFVTAPSCTVSPALASQIAYVDTIAAASLKMVTTNTAGTPVASTLTFICAGT